MEITVQTCQKLRKGWKRLPGRMKTLGLRQRQVQAKTINYLPKQSWIIISTMYKKY